MPWKAISEGQTKYIPAECLPSGTNLQLARGLFPDLPILDVTLSDPWKMKLQDLQDIHQHWMKRQGVSKTAFWFTAEPPRGEPEKKPKIRTSGRVKRKAGMEYMDVSDEEEEEDQDQDQDQVDQVDHVDQVDQVDQEDQEDQVQVEQEEEQRGKRGKGKKGREERVNKSSSTSSTM